MKTKKKVLTRNGTLFSLNSGKDQKKVFTRNEHFFPLNSSTDLRSDAHQSQIIGRDADEDHTQIVGGYTVKLLGDISSYPLRVTAPLLVSIAYFREKNCVMIWLI